jgi:hypothetical protein
MFKQRAVDLVEVIPDHLLSVSSLRAQVAAVTSGLDFIRLARA